MRDIKFRVWSEKFKQMRYWGFLDSDTFTGIPTGAGLTIDDCSKSMQFTGLKDHKGNNIYECDILVDRKSTWIVSWNDNHACFMVTNQEHPSVVAEVIDNQNMTIVGNIYENPDLVLTS